MLTMPRHAGFSLIELLATISVMVVLAVIAAPSLTTYAENAKIHATAEMFYASAQTARTEAVRRNSVVELALVSVTPDAANVDTNGLTTSGPNWLIRQMPPTGSDDHLFIEGKLGAEGGGRVSGSSVAVDMPAKSVQFNAAGGLVGTASAVADFKTSNGGVCAPTGSIRCLRVIVSTGGQARLCDPAITAASDPRKC